MAPPKPAGFHFFSTVYLDSAEGKRRALPLEPALALAINEYLGQMHLALFQHPVKF